MSDYVIRVTAVSFSSVVIATMRRVGGFEFIVCEDAADYSPILPPGPGQSPCSADATILCGVPMVAMNCLVFDQSKRIELKSRICYHAVLALVLLLIVGLVR